MTSYVSMPSAASGPVLLVFTPGVMSQKHEIDRLLALARPVLHPDVRIVRVSETTHPEVARSFGFTARPSFVLLSQGQELWRYADALDADELISQLVRQANASVSGSATYPNGTHNNQLPA